MDSIKEILNSVINDENKYAENHFGKSSEALGDFAREVIESDALQGHLLANLLFDSITSNALAEYARSHFNNQPGPGDIHKMVVENGGGFLGQIELVWLGIQAGRKLAALENDVLTQMEKEL